MIDRTRFGLVVKFKPRQYSFGRAFIYRCIGAEIGDSNLPAQLYMKDDQCKAVIGIASSSMADETRKPIVSMIGIDELMNGKDTTLRSRQSLEERVQEQGNVMFPPDTNSFLNIVEGI